MNNGLRNSIITRLPQEELDRVMPHMELVHLDPHDVLVEPDRPIEYIDFPDEGLHSMLALVEDAVVEVATVGFEGFIGIPVLLGTDVTSGKIFAQSPVRAHRLSTQTFKNLLEQCPRLEQLCKYYVVFVFDQAGQNSACNRTHTIEERCAKWLLLSHDRFEGDKFQLTQEFLAQMLGVRRQSVNIAAGILQQAGFIKYTRGDIQITNREGLESAACICYTKIRSALERYLSQ
jgi:CRP-like cAMP-binding protein